MTTPVTTATITHLVTLGEAAAMYANAATAMKVLYLHAISTRKLLQSKSPET